MYLVSERMEFQAPAQHAYGATDFLLVSPLILTAVNYKTKQLEY